LRSASAKRNRIIKKKYRGSRACRGAAARPEPAEGKAKKHLGCDHITLVARKQIDTETLTNLQLTTV